jgi:hypothetical protein
MSGRVNAFAGIPDPGMVVQLFRALYESIKRGVTTIARLSADAKFLGVAGDLARMSGAERAQLEAAFEEVKLLVKTGQAKGMDEQSLLGFVDRWALNRHKPGFQTKLAEEIRAWKPLTVEQRRALSSLEEQKRLVASLYEEKAELLKRRAELLTQQDRTADEVAELHEGAERLRELDPKVLPDPRPSRQRQVGTGQIHAAETTLAVREAEAAKARLSLYDRLRAAAPSDAARERALKGAVVDQVGPLKKPPTKLQADHIVSVREISDMDGFADLPWKDQKAIVDMRENLVAMDGAANASKGDRTWRSWKQADQFYQPTTINDMAKREAEVRALIVQEIGKRLASLPPGRP